jgi:hypothetical protein
MTRNTAIFTHAAVFAIGISVAMVMRGGSESGVGDGEERAESSTRELADGSWDAVGEKRAERVGKRDSAEGAGRSGGTAVERLAAIVRNPDAYDRQRALMDLIDGLGADEFAAVADEFRTANHLSGAGDEYELLLRGWAKVDPLGALVYVEEKDGGRGRGDILETWAGKDSAAAESWALAKHEGDGPNPFLAAVIRGVAAHDMEHASRLVQTMPNSRERGDAIEAMTRVLLAQGIEGALAFPGTIVDEGLRGGFVAEIANRYARQDAEGAAEWLVSMGDGDLQNRAARRVADALAEGDAKAAAAFVTRLSPEARAEAARGVIPRMSSEDIEGTARWVSTLAGTPGYDRVVEEFVWSCDQRAPEQSAAWIQGVSDPEQQRRLYHRMLGEWARRDGDAVRAWVTSNEVPADVMRRFGR